MEHENFFGQICFLILMTHMANCGYWSNFIGEQSITEPWPIPTLVQKDYIQLIRAVEQNFGW